MNGPSLADALAPAGWPTLVLVSARLVGLMLVAPLWSMAGVPKTARGAMIIVLALALLPMVEPADLPPDFMGLPVPLATELLIGLAIGLTGAVIMHAVALAGEIAALQMGLNLGAALSPMAESTTTGVGELKSMLALAVYVTMSGHLVLMVGLARSFQSIAPGGAIDLAAGAGTLITLTGTVFGTATRVAAPLIVALLLANFALAILNRAVPQLNAMAVAFPITIGMGLLMFAAALPFTGAIIGESVNALPQRVDEVLRALTPAPTPAAGAR